MGDLNCWPTLANGGSAATDFRPALAASQPANPDPSSIGAENWRAAEEATRRVLGCIQPTVASESRRKDVVEYVQKLLMGYLAAEARVFPFGSVPLKTYLPDGDIDLTAISYPNMEDPLANKVHSLLEVEEKNKEAEFEVKDVQFIHAEVKLVKCIVHNIVVDISFNQIGGLSTLCFLEKVDKMIGKDHIFKRSIVLIKAWCYYESRILGAHHGLISTYALETLVLHVFHLFHKSLNGPLAVLYRFLDYYSKFDWNNYCVSLPGPVPLSSLPEVIAEPPEIDGADLLFSNEFIKECLDSFSVSLRGFESNRAFVQKHLNIVDPLKQYNNLGRSVSKGNFYRIRSAFAYGARKLGRVLIQQVDRVAGEVSLFFANTLDRHGSGERPDVQGSANNSINGRYDQLSGFYRTTSHLRPEISNEEIMVSASSSQNSYRSLAMVTDRINISVSDREPYAEKKYTVKPLDQHTDFKPLQEYSKLDSHNLIADGVSGNRLSGDSRDLATDRDSDLRTTNDNCKVSPSRKAYHSTNFFFQGANGDDDEIDYDHPGTSTVKNALLSSARARDESISIGIDPTSRLSACTKSTASSTFGPLFGSSVVSLASDVLEDSRFSDSSAKENGHNTSFKFSNLSDLTGNEQLYRINFECALQLQEIVRNLYFLPVQPMSPSHYLTKHPWNSFPQPITPIGPNRILPGPPFSPTGSYLVNSPAISGAYATKDVQRTRGTGTYFPNTNSRSYRERQSPVKGKSQIFTNQPRSHYTSHSDAPHDRSMANGGKFEPSLNLQSPTFNGAVRRKPTHLDVPLSPRPGSRVISDGNAIPYSLERRLKIESVEGLSVEPSMSDETDKHEFENSQSHFSGPASPAPAFQRLYVNSKVERHFEPYQLKDDDDFPPLSG